jgi:hypothetical protein
MAALVLGPADMALGASGSYRPAVDWLQEARGDLGDDQEWPRLRVLLVGRKGIEPLTVGLKARCST